MRNVFDLNSKKEELLGLEEKTKTSDFWKNQKIAKEIASQISSLKDVINLWDGMIDEAEILSELSSQMDPSLGQELERQYFDLEKKYKESERMLFLSGEHDKRSAILSIYSGAGGQDAEDWASIIFRMYERYSENKGWNMQVLHKHENEHGGIKNATIEIMGPYAYGMLKKERGVHRLVRISPFSAKKLRHTSFAFIEVLPVLPRSGMVEIKDDELDVSFARSSGPGGQNVNKRSTAVRILHKPSGIQVHTSSGRSQAANREKAMQILEAKLLHIMEEAQKKEIDAFKGVETVKIEWGNQIRSYVFHPYRMVKDHRTKVETPQVDEVLDGDLDIFIDAEIKEIK